MIDLPADLLWGFIRPNDEAKNTRRDGDRDPRDALRNKHEYLE
jgi:hypothetical protein